MGRTHPAPSRWPSTPRVISVAVFREWIDHALDSDCNYIRQELTNGIGVRPTNATLNADEPRSPAAITAFSERWLSLGHHPDYYRFRLRSQAKRWLVAVFLDAPLRDRSR